MRDKCCGCGRIHDLDTACLDAAGGRIAQLEADMGSLQSHYAHEVSQRIALADELANANRRIEAHGPICLKWQYALHDADTRIRALEADVADVAKINVDLMKRNRELEAALLQERNGPIVCMEHRWGNACPWCALHANNAEIERLRGIVSHQDAKLVEGQSQSETGL